MLDTYFVDGLYRFFHQILFYQDEVFSGIYFICVKSLSTYAKIVIDLKDYDALFPPIYLVTSEDMDPPYKIPCKDSRSSD